MIESNSKYHTITLSVEGQEETIEIILPFIKTDNKKLYIAVDIDGMIDLYPKKPHFQHHSNLWNNVEFFDECNFKGFAYKNLATYKGIDVLDYSKVYKIKNPFLHNDYEDVKNQHVTLKLIKDQED